MALARRGAGSTGVLLALLLAVALVIGGFVLFSRGGNREAVDAGGAHTGVRTPTHATPLAEVEREAPRLPTPMDPPPPALGPQRFVGRGRIHGEVLAAANVTFPAAWSLIIEPSPTLIGSEHAVTRRIDFKSGEREFSVDDLPLAGYQVRATAEGLNCTSVSALLIRGSEVVFATLQFRPSGFIEGRVLAHDGSPADGVGIVLEESDTKLRRALKADASGGFVFHGVLDGAYKLFVGPPEAPLVKPGDIQFRAPSLRFQDVTLPKSGALRIETRAENGTPIADVEVSGFGTQGGAFRERTDFLGRVRVAWLPPGEYRIEARSEDDRRGRVTVSVETDADTDAILHLR